MSDGDAKATEQSVKPEPKPEPAPAVPQELVDKATTQEKSKTGRRPHPGGQGYGAAKRGQIVEEFRALIKAGASRQQALAQVGFSDQTLRHWEVARGLKPASSVVRSRYLSQGRPEPSMGRKRGRPRKTPAAEVQPTGGFVLVTPNGFRLEGIQLEDLLKVLQAIW
jgi:hypothetical protein